MPNSPENPQLEPAEITELKRQLSRLSNAIAEFEAMAAELKERRPDARVTEMIRMNRETLTAIYRSAEIVEERLQQAEFRAQNRTTSHPFP